MQLAIRVTGPSGYSQYYNPTVNACCLTNEVDFTIDNWMDAEAIVDDMPSSVRYRRIIDVVNLDGE